ncbi:MAG: ATP-binding protein [Deltaproteobacteria bacterium]|nr:ATP-binding protein [Deltaproteobacteria bacterium]
MKQKSSKPPSSEAGAGDLATVRAQMHALELELDQKNRLLEEGFAAFTMAAEKLQDSHKRLQQQVAELNVELDGKNQELERNLAEKEKVKSYLSNIFESLPVGVLVTDLNGDVTSVNRAGLMMIGQPAEALVGCGVNEIMHAEVLGQENGRDPGLGESREEGRDAHDPDDPLTFQRADGATLKLRLSLTPMTGEGRELGYILNLQDVTLLKQLEEHAQRRNRFTVMGEMAANMAHEIRNPLGSIELFASLVKKGLPENDEKLALMNHISQGIASMNHIISNVLEYTKPRPLNLRKLDVIALLREVGEFYRYTAGQNGVNVEFAFEMEAGSIRGDADLLRQVFQNLLLNAIQAMTEGGTLSLGVRSRTLNNPKQLARFGEGSRGKGLPVESLEVLEVVVRDTGPGIPREVLGKIFDPFFTTKARGTGLGLVIVHNIVESHQATIDVESRVGQGSEFIVTFPRAD